MKILKSFAILIYIAFIVGFLYMSYIGNILPDWMFPLTMLKGNVFWTIFTLAIFFTLQILFIIIPKTITSIMMTFLINGLLAALIEFFNVENLPNIQYFSWTIIIICWLALSMLLFKKYRYTNHDVICGKLSSQIFTSSLVELLIAVPIYFIITNTRSGWLVGLASGYGIVCGSIALLWIAGLMIAFSLIQRKR